MKTDTNESQVQRLKNWLLLGLKVDRVTAFRKLKIADLRSRISNCQDELGIVFDRERVPGKRYLRYYISNPKHLPQ